MQETGKENAKQDRKNNKKKWMILAVVLLRQRYC